MLQPSNSQRSLSHTGSHTSSREGSAKKREQVGKDTAESPLAQDTVAALPSTIAMPMAVLPMSFRARHSMSGSAEAWSSPELPTRPVPVPAIHWQPYKRRTEEGEATNLPNSTAGVSPSTSPEPHLAAQSSRGHSKSEADLAGSEFQRKNGRKLAKNKRRPRSQQRDKPESAFTRYTSSLIALLVDVSGSVTKMGMCMG